MIDIREILVRIFSAIFLSMCTGSCMFVFWMVLRKFFADKIRPKVYDLILKIILIAYYVPAGYLLVNIFFDNGYVFDFTGTIINAFYDISLFWLAGAIATVLKFGERTFRIRREKERCFPCKMYVQKIFEDCKKELGIRRSIEVLQGYRIQIPMTAGILKPCVFLPVEDMEEEQLKTCIYHELTHYKKYDIFWNYIACLMVCIHWYCPWIRTVFRKNDEWSEVICDLSAIGYVGSAKRYFTTIFEMSQKSQGIKAYRAACLFESQDSLEQRIYYAMMYRKQKKIKYAAVIAMTVIFCGMSVKEAVFWLLDFAGYRRIEKPVKQPLVHQVSQKQAEERKPFVLPELAGDNSYLISYLNQERGISRTVIDLFLKDGLIYESRHYHNVVFKGNDKNGVTRFASMRGVFDKQGKPFKCDVTGNDKNYGFNVVNVNSTELVVFEAAIDLMSYVDIFADYESNKLALGMLADAPLETFLREHPQITSIRFCLDGDEPGRKAAAELMRKYYELGYEVEDCPPPAGYKDYNEWLVAAKLNLNRMNKRADEPVRA